MKRILAVILCAAVLMLCCACEKKKSAKEEYDEAVANMNSATRSLQHTMDDTKDTMVALDKLLH